jgi:large subunit ribosomal protein L25
VERIDLNASIRNTTGKGPARELRREGQIPAILYGPEAEPVLLSFTQADISKALKGGNVNQILFNLKINTGQTAARTAMIKELQMHPVSRHLLHVDFYEIAMDRKIKISIPVETKGKSPGVEQGGILQLIRRDLEVLCLPSEIPASIEIDVSNLHMGESIHLDEIPLEGNVEFPEDVNFTVVTVLSPKVEEIIEEEEGEEGAAEEEAEAEGEDASS